MIPLVLSAAGVVSGIIALVLIIRRTNQLKGWVYAIAGLVLGWVHLAGQSHWITSGVAPRALALETWIHCYIAATDGCFPTGEEDLQESGFLRRTVTAGGVKYAVRNQPDSARWRRVDYFDWFKIAYGADANNIEASHRKLYDKTTGKQVLLIEGPYKRVLKHTYEAISFRWYKAMHKERPGATSN
jgi:hypothetical protein